MAPSAALLFHPKKTPTNRLASPRKAGPPRPKAEVEEEDDEHKLPEGPFQEFKLMSSSLSGWKYNVMKFDSRKPVDITTWQAPIKLNRKELRREEPTAAVQVAVGPMLGPDSKPVIGQDGQIVMIDAEGRPIHNVADPSSSQGAGSKDAKGKGVAAGRKKFTKKTRQVFLVPEATRQLRREERQPWVFEDAVRDEVWVGQLEEVAKSENYAFFMPAANDTFKYVPSHRWYKFQKKPKHKIPTLEEAEALMAQQQKNRDPERWLLHHRNGKAPSSATAAMFKGEADNAGSSSLVHSSSQSLGPGGRKLKTVDNGMGGLFGDDEEDGEMKKRKKEMGEDGDLDEQEYEEDFADDDEKVEPSDHEDDEEAKELEERLKREYKTANKQREGGVDESDDDMEEDELTKDGKGMKKLLRNLEKNVAYDSDEEKNPYASSEEEEEEEEPIVANGPAVQQQPQQVTPSGSQTPSNKNPRPKNGSAAPSRATSPVPGPGLGGHSVVAMRATSPKAPKLKTNGSNRGNSPLAGASGVSSRGTSPVNGAGNRAVSPVGGNTSRAGSPFASQKKRKATEDLGLGNAPSPVTTVPPKAKKRKATNSAPAVPTGELEDRMVVEWLRNTPNATTRDCIQHFTPYLTDEAKKKLFTELVKEVAQLKGGILVLRNAYKGGSGAPSPAPTPQ